MTRALVASAILFLAGCAAFREPQPQPNVGRWAEERDHATRGAKLYDGLDHLATASTVYLSSSVREARARRLGEWLNWTPAELDLALRKEGEEARKGETFLVSFYTSDWSVNDLDSKNSVWHLSLLVGETSYLATGVEGYPVDLNAKALFPMIGGFDSVYLLHFPVVEGGLEGRRFVLRIASGIGSIDLDFAKPPGLPSGIDAVPPAAR